jgi:hypothetical protein
MRLAVECKDGCGTKFSDADRYILRAAVAVQRDTADIVVGHRAKDKVSQVWSPDFPEYELRPALLERQKAWLVASLQRMTVSAGEIVRSFRRRFSFMRVSTIRGSE